jgi:hypothetical protein
MCVQLDKNANLIIILILIKSISKTLMMLGISESPLCYGVNVFSEFS